MSVVKLCSRVTSARQALESGSHRAPGIPGKQFLPVMKDAPFPNRQASLCRKAAPGRGSKTKRRAWEKIVPQAPLF
ncbi:MAG: hypothetical protein ACLTEJ_11280 [Neglectibacter timonensis]|uniref:hypothetical protein n=1 Tax=Neglectibacter timonensis TaxID=1776382 RepID=UPI0039918EBB